MKYLLTILFIFIAWPLSAEPMVYNYTTDIWYVIESDSIESSALEIIKACSKSDTWGIGSDSVLIPANGETEGINIFNASIAAINAISNNDMSVIKRDVHAPITFIEWDCDRCDWKTVQKLKMNGRKKDEIKYYIEVE